jgi:predicted nucleotidyltransferase
MQNSVAREEIFSKIASFLKKYGATKIAVFGSYIRGEERLNIKIKF